MEGAEQEAKHIHDTPAPYNTQNGVAADGRDGWNKVSVRSEGLHVRNWG